ncbi:MAG: hypothetical protein ABIS26_01335 [Candidatus Paceibacterota bacterium]
MGQFERVISMYEAKQRLFHLREYLPGEGDRLVYDFGYYIAYHLGSDTSPRGFVESCYKILERLAAGDPDEGRIFGYRKETYVRLRADIPRIAGEVFENEPQFAESVIKLLGNRATH